MNTKDWKWFSFADIFKIEKGKRLTKADMIEGDIPYIGAIDSNNGISAKISNDQHIHSGNTITVSYNGSIAEAFYQTKSFWATDDVNVLYPKFDLTPYIALFLCTIIHREKYRFNYGRKWDKELMKQSFLKLPITSENKPDWNKIENFVKNQIVPSLPEKTKSVWNKNFNKTPLSPKKVSLDERKWEWFYVKEIFDCATTRHAVKQDMVDGNTPLITRSALNNGLSDYIDSDGSQINEGNCITIGAEGVVAFYQPYNFVTGVKVYTLRNRNMNVFNSMFIITLLNLENYRYNYGNARILEKIKNEKIKLPITKTPTGIICPDWQFMEDYIKSLPYSGCL
ncbi:restriction endonuclease subunit S [Capnocytophaga catalasegens]|nr:restriction endonuclease subunit S [Capnocytophaga catalasegens]